MEVTRATKQPKRGLFVFIMISIHIIFILRGMVYLSYHYRAEDEKHNKNCQQSASAKDFHYFTSANGFAELPTVLKPKSWSTSTIGSLM